MSKIKNHRLLRNHTKYLAGNKSLSITCAVLYLGFRKYESLGVPDVSYKMKRVGGLSEKPQEYVINLYLLLFTTVFLEGKL